MTTSRRPPSTSSTSRPPPPPSAASARATSSPTPSAWRRGSGRAAAQTSPTTWTPASPRPSRRPPSSSPTAGPSSAPRCPASYELRRKAAEDPLGFLEGGDRPGGADLPDDVSVAASSRLSTSASLFTRYTGKDGRGTTVAGTATSSNTRAAARNRKREEKKRARGRKGTVYEEEYLVNSVRRLVERVASTQPEIERLVFALARRGMTERARAVEKLMCELVDGCRAAVTELWPPPAQGEKPKQEEPQGPAEDGAAANGVVLGPDGRAIIVRDQEEEQDPPTLRDFARLSLLG